MCLTGNGTGREIFADNGVWLMGNFDTGRAVPDEQELLMFGQHGVILTLLRNYKINFEIFYIILNKLNFINNS